MTTALLEPRQKVEAAQVYVPRADIYESGDQLVVLADMPGVRQESIDITIEQNILTIYGKVEEPQLEGYNLVYSEYGVGDYRRVFTLSNEIDKDGIQATIKNGVLRLLLPKSKASLPRKISVTSCD